MGDVYKTVQVSAGGYERYDKPVDVAMDLADGIQVVEVLDTGEVVDDSVPFQVADHMLTFIMMGTTGGDQTRIYQIRSVDSVPEVLPLVTVDEGVVDEGFESVKISTQNAAYFYHVAGAGFSSMVDVDGNDWIGFHPWGGSDGKYRGIPNLVHPEGYFHPGNEGCVSEVVHEGPIKTTIHSASQDGLWECQWEIYPQYATLTVLKAAREYWFLYEGTPGGELDEVNDYIARSDGTRTPASESWDENLPNPEWLYFGAGNTDRVLFLAHHEDDDAMDSYWPMQSNMTVFGFGRLKLEKFMTRTPNQFTIGFAEGGDFDAAQRVIESAYRPLEINMEG